MTFSKKKKKPSFFLPLKKNKINSNISHRLLLMWKHIFQWKNIVFYHCTIVLMSDYSPLWNIYTCFRSIYPLFYQGHFLQINQFTLQVLLRYFLGLFGTCKSRIQTLSGVRFYLQMHFPPQQCCARCGMGDSDQFLFTLSCFGILTSRGYTSSTSWALLGESPRCMPWTLLCPCLQLSQAPAWAAFPVDWLSVCSCSDGTLHSQVTPRI